MSLSFQPYAFIFLPSSLSCNSALWWLFEWISQKDHNYENIVRFQKHFSWKMQCFDIWGQFIPTYPWDWKILSQLTLEIENLSRKIYFKIIGHLNWSHEDKTNKEISKLYQHVVTCRSHCTKSTKNYQKKEPIRANNPRNTL